MGITIKGRFIGSALASGLLLCCASGASAAIYKIDLSTSTDFRSSFLVDTSKINASEGNFFYNNDALPIGFFYNSNFDNPLSFEYGDQDGDIAFGGPQLYTGSESSPTLLLGTSNLTSYNGGPTGSINISAASGPGAPSPEVGAGLLSALAAAAALFLTRMRKPKSGLVTA